jgi:hypothetical protein
MDEKSENQAQRTKEVVFVSIMAQLAETLKGYYNEHQATGCKCSLCKRAESALRKMGMTR